MFGNKPFEKMGLGEQVAQLMAEIKAREEERPIVSPTGGTSAKTLLNIIQGRQPNPFVDLEGKTYLRFDEITTDGVKPVFVLRWRGDKIAEFPMNGPTSDMLVLSVKGGLLEVTIND